MQDPSPREAVPGLAITFQKLKKKSRVSTGKMSMPRIFYGESRGQNWLALFVQLMQVTIFKKKSAIAWQTWAIFRVQTIIFLFLQASQIYSISEAAVI